MLRSWVFAALAIAVARAAPLGASSTDLRAAEIVAKFTIDDMVGQMTQLSVSTVLKADGTLDEDKVTQYAKQRVGSYLGSPFGVANGTFQASPAMYRKIIKRIQEITMEENGGHPIIYGIDSVHGANYVEKATLFPQQINAGASFNPELVNKMGAITAQDTVAAGIPWTFGPILEISQNKLWARTFETFGEDPYLVATMGAAIIKGIQSTSEVAACMKHFVGYSKTPAGYDRDGVTLSDFDLLNYFALPFIEATKAGVMTAMENYVSINGVPVVANPKILRDLIRHDIGFDGFVVTDWAEIDNLHSFHRVAKSRSEAVRMALTRTSLDMSMVPNDVSFIDYAKDMLKTHPEYLDRIRESAQRIVKAKLELGLYENPLPGEKAVARVGQDEDRAVALDLARESIVLLQNKDNVLPIPQTASVFLTGHSADDIGNLCGGWSLGWQGYSGNTMYPNGISIKQGLETVVDGNGTSVTYFNGLFANGSYDPADLDKAKALAAKAEYTVVAMGEATYAEKPGDISDLALPAGQIEYVKQLASTGTKVIVVLVGGRPRLLNGLPAAVHGVIDAMLPCEAGGQAIAEIIYGKVNPSGRLPITYPNRPANVDIQYNRRVNTQCGSTACEAEWNFGAGLSYTTFTYSDLKLSKNTVSGEKDTTTVSVTVTNSGKVKGKETAMLFITQPYRSLSVPEVKMLKKFIKVEILPGKSTTVNFELTYKDWSVFKPQIGHGFNRVAENGDYVVAIKPETVCDPYGDTLGSDLCAKFSVVDSVVPFQLNEPVVSPGIQIAATDGDDTSSTINISTSL